MIFSILPMAQTVNLDSWLPMGDVVAKTGMSERTVYRAVTEGKIRQAQRPIPGRRPLTVFNPDDVAALIAAMVPSANALQTTGQRDALAMLTQALQRREGDEPAGSLPPSELRFKLYLSEDEAIVYTGFGRAYLRAKAAGKNIGPRGSTVYKRSELETL